ncbi:putative lipase ROG1 isoform X2 [Solanum dulcamara]|uniref:putative lipase ROG1 isoform X2 n=1 Tax=Solanum dulcamara TaxID=45834 RepID=UPI002486C579|nr:putative lipase ROG1 isoform X2 [Solanum dulcamara]
MGSSEMEKGSNFSDEDRVEERKSEMGIENSDKKEEKKSDMGIQKNENSNKKTRRKMFSIFPRCACMRLDDEVPVVETPADEGGFNVEASQKGPGPAPNHLVVMVNGIIGSVEDWKYGAEQFVKAYPQDIIVYRSQSNCSKLTFDGVDVMGTRLAEEVLSVIKRTPHLQKISFVGHSLGGLVCRYAIAKLYEQRSARIVCEQDMECSLNGSTNSCEEEVSKRNIAGLEPMNFITFATPHLGCRGHKQAPAFCGLYSLEKLAASSSWLLGRSGRHLFLKDCDEGKPLLLRMASNSEDLPFISALQSFKRRVAYANTCFDYLVGWSTSSLRRRNELPKHRNLKKVDKYPHIVNVDMATSVSSQEETPTKAKINRYKSQEMEEAMIRGLTKLSWERVDVSFKGSKQRYLAHTAIQVQSYSINSDGADVIQHMIDNFAL